MRDLVVLGMVIAAVIAAFRKPWLGVIALAIFAYLNPHRYAWGFSRTMPIYLIVFAATMASMFFNAKDRQPFPWTRETKLMLALIGWFTLTTFWEPDIPGAAKNQWLKVMKIYVGILPTFWLIDCRERLRWLVLTIGLSFGLIGFKGGLFAIAKGFHHRVWGPDNTFYGGNNEIALALNMSLPLIMLSAKETESRNVKLFLYATFALTVCSVIGSWSRGGLMALCVVLGMMVLFGRRKWLSVPILALAVMFALPNLPEEWFSRMDTIKSYEEDQSVMGRFEAWRYARERAAEKPLTGGGFETFQYAYVDAHSAYFEILGEHGYVALGIWLSLLFGTVIALERLRRRSYLLDELDWVRNYARALQISLMAYAAGGITLGVAYWDYFYHLVAICVILKVIFAKAVRENAMLKGVGA